MTRTLAPLLIAVVVLLASPVFAEPPPTVVQQGRIVEDGQPVNGTRTLDFDFVSDMGEVVYNESHEVELIDGFYSIHLGQSGDLADITLRQNVAEIQISVDGNPLLPGHSLASVPYAHVAKSVEGGLVVANTIAVGTDEKDATIVIDATGAWVGQGYTVPCQGCVDTDSLGPDSVDGSKVADGTIERADVAFPVYGNRAMDLYEATNSVDLAAAATGIVSANCADDNDLPLQGYCPTTGVSLVELIGTDASTWTSTNGSASFTCSFRNNSGNVRSVTARLICITVP